MLEYSGCTSSQKVSRNTRDLQIFLESEIEVLVAFGKGKRG